MKTEYDFDEQETSTSLLEVTEYYLDPVWSPLRALFYLIFTEYLWQVTGIIKSTLFFLEKVLMFPVSTSFQTLTKDIAERGNMMNSLMAQKTSTNSMPTK